jgi:hypothetical protein
MTGITPLTIDNATGYYDGENRILFVDYHGTLTAYVTAHVQRWIAEVLESLGDLGALRGIVYNFRQVTAFDSPSSTQRQPAKYDLSRIPTAMITRDLYQERLLRVTLSLSPQKCQRFVHTMPDALAFVEQFNRLHSAVDT